MTNDDEKLSQLLNRLAPPERDPLFRVRVMESKQRQWFRQRVVSLLGVLVIVVVTAVVGISASGATHETARWVVLGIGAAAGVAIYASALRHVIRRFRI